MHAAGGPFLHHIGQIGALSSRRSGGSGGISGRPTKTGRNSTSRSPTDRNSLVIG